MLSISIAQYLNGTFSAKNEEEFQGVSADLGTRLEFSTYIFWIFGYVLEKLCKFLVKQIFISSCHYAHQISTAHLTPNQNLKNSRNLRIPMFIQLFTKNFSTRRKTLCSFLTFFLYFHDFLLLTRNSWNKLLIDHKHIIELGPTW